jgi:arabinosaccharide transport system permease protein
MILQAVMTTALLSNPQIKNNFKNKLTNTTNKIYNSCTDNRISYIDGCSEFKIFFIIIAPLMKPAFGAMTILMAMTSWNSFVWPLIVLRSTEKLTLPVGLASLITPYGNNYDMLMPGAVMSVIPVAIIFLLNQRAFIEGLTAGGIKQ